MIRGEVYYKFIFPNYNKLSGTGKSKFGTDQFPVLPTNDGDTQEGEVLSLCRACPDNVITYDQLADNPDTPVSIYNNTNWPLSKKREIRSYVDQWKDIPKYFNLRNYWDHDPPQEGGMSLMVSHSPEVGLTSTPWTKFTASNGKVVYCSLMVSSGDFFYSYCLPDEVIAKSGLKNVIINERFHKNWWTTAIEKSNYWRYYSTAVGSTRNPPQGDQGSLFGEKRVFVQHYFLDDYVVKLGYKVKTYTGDDGLEHSKVVPLHIDATDSIYTDPNDPAYTDPTDENYTNGIFPYVDDPPGTKNGKTAQQKIADASDADTRILNFQNNYVFTTGWNNLEYKPEHVPAVEGDHVSLPYNCGQNADTGKLEDLKYDFINLEATRRILYYHNGTQLKYNNDSVRDIHPTSDIPRYISSSGKTTVLSYEPPDEYLDSDYIYNGGTVRGTPPLKIKYNLLRYAMNDRPPFTDCETVLVMWVANKGDPANVPDGDVEGLHNLVWEQYAIPISVRCCYKGLPSSVTEDNGVVKKHCNKRFLVSYPTYQSKTGTIYGGKSTGSITKSSTCPFHFHFNEAYEKNIYKDALFAKDLVDYSQDYVVSLHIRGGAFIDGDNFFDTQKYLFKTFNAQYSEGCSALYVRKKYLTDDYIKVNADTPYDTTKWVWSQTVVPLSYRNTVCQAYYIYVPERLYTIDINSTPYIRDRSGAAFTPTTAKDTDNQLYFRRKNFEKWDFAYINGWGPVRHKSGAPTDHIDSTDPEHPTPIQPNAVEECAVYDTWFIALFDASKLIIDKVTGGLSIVDAAGLYSYLNIKIPPRSDANAWDNWDDLYITSFGISPYNICEDESYMYLPSKNSDAGHIYPLGLLNNHVQIGNTVYGTDSVTGKVIVGFKQMYDYKYEDLYHFRYENGEYKPVRVIYNAQSNTYLSETLTNPVVTAYVMNYSD